MSLFVIVKKSTYVDSLATLFTTSVLLDAEGIETAYAAMATEANKKTMAELGLINSEIESAGENDFVIAARAQSEEAFEKAAAKTQELDDAGGGDKNRISYPTVEAAVEAHPRANICSIAVPGEYALEEVKKALHLGLHCVVFSNNVPLEDEREMKELALKKGLLCMGPDCGVANINGAAFVLASINNTGPFGICGASGCGIQHVAAIMHEVGSGISQGIGTGGNDLKEPVGGISMLMGIDALENDPETKYIVLISRKPAEDILKKLLDRIAQCKKPVVVFFMGATRQEVEATGAIWAENLDDCAQKALALIGKEYPLASDEEIAQIAREAVTGMSPQQKYVRGAFNGGTYCDEVMRAMQDKIGGIHSNCPLSPELKLADSYKSVGNTVIDYGEEEFTLGRPHPVIDPGVRKPAILREAGDPETAVLLMDFILTPPGNMDPAGAVIGDIQEAMRLAQSRGGRLAVVASVLGTDADFQDVRVQRDKLRQAGVYVCQTNYRAGLLAGEIIRLKNERDAV
ncbi:MAG: FdrA family protein [Christensenellales bacterium]|jgi:FdrA protein